MGYINSIETMGLVDGPGIRFVVFMQGCLLRCLYCHNPETWNVKSGKEISPAELVDKIKRYKPYFEDNGGVTFSGGEPLLQPDFLIETMKLCKKNNIHTCLDTAGVGTNKDKDVLKYTDLVILDIKATNNTLYKKITGHSIDKVEKFIDICNKLNKKMWLRQVIVPGINDNEESILELKKYIKKINNVEKVELIPYHTYGEDKYKKLDLKYPLESVEPMNETKLNKLNELLKSDTLFF